MALAEEHSAKLPAGVALGVELEVGRLTLFSCCLKVPTVEHPIACGSQSPA
jgi:hypothetical protein